ncbi:putative Thioredoxin-like superfamily [Plasmopara halstedii]
MEKEEISKKKDGRTFSPLRFMQVALAITLFFSITYMYQFVTVSITLRSVNDSEDSKDVGIVRNRVLGHSILHLQGFEAAHKFVSDYDIEQGPLYILFMSDADENGKYWCPDCERAKKPVMDAFNRAPRGSKLVEIRVGPQSYWSDYMNEFRQNQLFYLDHIPTLMRYEGGGNSSTMLTESFCNDPDLLDYVFRVNKPLAGKPHENKVLTMTSPTEVINYVGTYDHSHPLFLFFVSGNHDFNGRLWCPYCDRADVAVMHYFNYTALDDAVLIRIVVSNSYKEWKKNENPFKQLEFREKVTLLQGVPYLGFVRKDLPANKVHVFQFMPDYVETQKLLTFFKNRPIYYCNLIFGHDLETFCNLIMYDRRRHNHSNVRVWLQRNLWLVTASVLIVIYCIFTVYTTTWMQIYSEQKESKHLTQESHNLMDVTNVFKDNSDNTMEEMASEIEYEEEEDRMKIIDTNDISYVRTVATVPVSRAEVPFKDFNVEEEHEKVISDVPTSEVHDVVKVLPSDEGSTNESVVLLVSETETIDNHYESWNDVDELSDVVNHHAPISDTSASSSESFTNASTLYSSLPIARIRPIEYRKTFDKTRLKVEISEQSGSWIPFENRHHKIVGYNATLEYLQYYTKAADSKEELFLFFTCSTRDGDQDDWNPNCATAREKVYSIFSKSPSTNRLVTIYAGTYEDWMDGNNFTFDDDLRLKAVPTLMRWDGGTPGSLRSTWGVLVDVSILYDPFVRYLFRNTDKEDQLLVKPEVESKEIITVRGYSSYRAYVDSYVTSNFSYPLFMMVLSGRLEHNNRLWCPWCRQSELPVEYAFYAYAPVNAKLLLIETYDNRSEWRNPDNEFKVDPQLAIKGVPWFYRVSSRTLGDPLVYEHIKKKFYLLEALEQVFAPL